MIYFVVVFSQKGCNVFTMCFAICIYIFKKEHIFENNIEINISYKLYLHFAMWPSMKFKMTLHSTPFLPLISILGVPHTLLNASYEAKLSLADLFNLPPLHVNASFAFHISVIREISYAATCSTFLCLSPFPPINLMIKACFTFFGLLLTFYIMRYMLWDYKSNGKWSKEDVVNRLEDGIGSSFRGKRSTTNDQGHLIGVSVFLLKTGI